MRRRPERRKRVKGKLFIICNGTKTEVNYFKSLSLSLGKQSKYLVDAKAVNASPSDMIHKVAERKIKLKGFDKELDNIYCVFDVDEFIDNNKERFVQTIHEAKENNINLIWSNPCFELWILNHFNFSGSEMNAAECTEALKKKYKNELSKDYSKTTPNLYNDLQSKIQNAVANSSKYQFNQSSLEKISINPSTNVHILVNKILELNNLT